MKGNIGFIRRKLFNNLVSEKHKTILEKLGEELEIDKVINSNSNLIITIKAKELINNYHKALIITALIYRNR